MTAKYRKNYKNMEVKKYHFLLYFNLLYLHFKGVNFIKNI